MNINVELKKWFVNLESQCNIGGIEVAREESTEMEGSSNLR